MKKKVLSVLLATTMMISLAGCQASEKEASESVSTSTEAEKDVAADKDVVEEEKEPTVISFLFCENATEATSDDWMLWDTIEEKANVIIDYQAVPSSDYTTKVKAILNTGALPDIISFYTPTASECLAELFLPVNEYEDQMPNYKAWLDGVDGAREDLENSVQADGNYYVFPTSFHDARYPNMSWMIRQDIFDLNNIPVPTTMDEIFEAATTLKEIYPDVAPITNRFKAGNIFVAFGNAFGTNAGNATGTGAFYVEDEDKWVFGPTTDNWKDMLAYTHSLYENGLLDQEYSTLESTVYEQRLFQDENFILYDYPINCARYNTEGQATNPDFNVVPIMAPTGPYGDYSVARTPLWQRTWVVPADAPERENFEEILGFIDWGYSDEGAVALSFGEEGVTYKADNGELSFIDSEINYAAQYGYNQNSMLIRQHPDLDGSRRTEETKAVFGQLNDMGLIQGPAPASPLSGDQIEEYSVANTVLIDYVKQMMEEFTSGVTSLDKWDDFVAECEAKGCNEYIDAYNEAWAAK